MPRHHQRATGVRHPRRLAPARAGEPALEQAGHERVTGAEDVHYLDREAGDDLLLRHSGWHIALEHGTAPRAQLHHQRSRSQGADGAEGLDEVLVSAGDPELLLRPDDEVEAGQHLLEMGGDPVAADEALLPRRGLGEPPEDRPVVDVEHGRDAVAAGTLERERADLVHVLGGEVRSSDQERAARGDERLLVAHRHVGAVLAVEDQGEGLAIADPEQHQGGEAVGIHRDVGDVTALGGEGLLEEATHVIVADSRGHRGAEPEPRAAERDVGRRAAQVLRHARHVLQTRAELLGVEIHGQPAEADDVERAALGGRFSRRAHPRTVIDRSPSSTPGSSSRSPSDSPFRGSRPAPRRSSRRTLAARARREWP